MILEGFFYSKQYTDFNGTAGGQKHLPSSFIKRKGTGIYKKFLEGDMQARDI